VFGLFGGNPSRDQFASMLLKEAKRAGITTAYEYDAKEFTLKAGSGRLYLGNFHDTYCQANAEHKKKLIGNFIATMQLPQVPDSFEEAKANLVTVIRERALFAFTEMEYRIKGNESGLKVACEPMTAWFTKSLVIDFPKCVSVVSTEHLKKWGVTFEEATTTGLEHLRACTTPNFIAENGYFISKWNDDYDSSRPLLAELFDDLPLEGDPVIAIPNRLTMLVTGSRQADAIKAMLAKAEEIVRTIARPQNPAPLVITNGEIADFTVDKTSPVFSEVCRAHGLAALFYYNQQVELLNQLHEKTGKDTFVAKYALNKLIDGSYQSYCIWSKGIVSLLPKTDTVVLYDPGQPEKKSGLGTIAWDKLISVAGGLMLDTEMFPARYYVSKFPEGEMLEKVLG
jgi:hypothetical protein